MACTDCLQNCDKIISDQCVQYTGPAIPLLGICTGDSLSQTENNIITALLSALDGSGINPSTVTLANCTWLSQQLGVTSPTLNNLLQLLINGEGTLHSMITAIQSQIAAGQSGTVFDTSCLTGLPATPTVDDIIQAIIIQLCQAISTIATFPSTYVQNSDLNGLVTNIVNNIIGTGSTNTIVQQNTKMVPFVAYEYYGPLSNFDISGQGITSLGYQKIYLCTGNFGTPDKRGRVAVGAIRNVPGGALDAAVDPANPLNPNWSLNDKAGETAHTLSTAEIPSHSHAISDPGHNHNLGAGNGVVEMDTAGHGPASGGGFDGAAPILSKTDGAVTGITGTNSVGGGGPHNNIQPSIAANYIMYIP